MTVEYRRLDGSIAGAQARIVDYKRPEANDWLAVNQFTVVDGGHGAGRTSCCSSTACRSR